MNDLPMPPDDFLPWDDTPTEIGKVEEIRELADLRSKHQDLPSPEVTTPTTSPSPEVNTGDLWKAMEKECGKKWFLGATFSAIDIYLMFMTYWTPGRDWFKENCPKIFAVSNRVAKIEPFKTLIKEHTEEGN